jgi:hypothetical protein
MELSKVEKVTRYLHGGIEHKASHYSVFCTFILSPNHSEKGIHFQSTAFKGDGEPEHRLSTAVDYATEIADRLMAHDHSSIGRGGQEGWVDGEVGFVLDFNDFGGDHRATVAYDLNANYDYAGLIPDHRFFATNGFFDLKLVQLVNPIPWADKKPVAFWRGSTTGPRVSAEDFLEIPRVQLAILSSQNNAVLDARITQVVQVGGRQQIDKVTSALSSKGLLSERIPFGQFARYRYLIELDGNVTPWSFLPKMMLGCCILKSETTRKQWYYDRIKPWVHYVPICSDLSDVIEKVNWCLSNEDAAREISENAKAFAQDIDFSREIDAAALTALRVARAK